MSSSLTGQPLKGSQGSNLHYSRRLHVGHRPGGRWIGCQHGASRNQSHRLDPIGWVPIGGKRVELLKDLKPDLSRLAVLLQPNNLTADSYLQDAERVGRALGLSTRAFAVQGLDDLPRAFAAMVEWQANGVITLNDAFFFSQRERVVALTLGNKLAAVHPEAEFVEAGGLLSYGANLSDLFRRAAFYVDKILKGAKPADIPIEQASKFDLVVNLKAARTLGLTVTREFLLRADEVIE
jgi:ABC-type uncharacterized transport system substrate-binding protein